MYNGMAAAADWMSAASFISLSGALYLQGFGGSSGQPGGLAYLLGWTGGFCLVAMLVAPHLRAMNLYTLPDFFQQRFGGRWPRTIAAIASIVCSFTYVVAQIYGVGLIASRLTGVQFEIGIMLGLGGVLLCSFLGGMRAVTWTQVAQYVVILLAFLIPVSWLAYKQLGNPVAAVAYASQLQKIAELEAQLLVSPQELSVQHLYSERAERWKPSSKMCPWQWSAIAGAARAAALLALHQWRYGANCGHQPRIRQLAAQSFGGRAAMAPATARLP
jgi:Predicted symporter